MTHNFFRITALCLLLAVVSCNNRQSFRHDGYKWIAYRSADFDFDFSGVSGMAVDQDGLLLFGNDVQGYGLARMDKRGDIEIFSEASSEIPDNRISDILLNDEGNAWVGHGNYLSEFLGNGFNWNSIYSDTNTYSCCQSLYSPTDGTLWGGGNQVLIDYNGISITSYPAENNNNGSFGFISSLLLDDSGEMWLGTLSGLWSDQGAGPTNFGQVAEISGEIKDIKQDQAGNIWVISNNSLWQLDQDSLVWEDMSANLNLAKPSSLAIWPDGSLWVGTLEGLYKYDGEWNLYTNDDSPLIDDQIQKLITDEDGNLWMGTEEGIMKIENR